MVDFSKYCFRASQMSKLLTGTIGLTDIKKARMIELQVRKMDAATGGEDANGKPIKPLTANMEKELADLIETNKDNSLPLTMRSELRKIFRMEKYNRNFPMSNKYIVKGLAQEEEAITNYQNFRNQKGIRTLFSKNTERINNEFFSGEPDLGQMGVPILEWEEGFDTKCSWGLDTFPFAEDKLDFVYETQNQIYMDLTGAKKWTTAYCLVNIHEHGLNNEKLKVYYATNCPDNEEHESWAYYQKQCLDIEKSMIFDYNRFIEQYPYHQMVHTKEQWFDEGNDIPLEDRIIEKVSTYDHEFIEFAKSRVEIGRKYLTKLSEQ